MRRFLPLVVVCAALAAVVAGLSSGAGEQRTLSRYRTQLEGRMQDQRHNAILCLKALDGAVIPPHSEFSFNETVGSWSRDKGYRRAPVSFGGLLVDSWGGGVCQTSSTLYNAALLAGLEVVERHKHHYAPTYIPPGRDAAVAFPNIDLRLRNPHDFPVTVRGHVSATGVSIELVGVGRVQEAVKIEQRVVGVARPQELLIGTGRYGRVRNPGHAGFSVETYRVTSAGRELLSVDEYPVMNKIIEYKGE